MISKNFEIVNKKANYQFNISDSYVAGIMLKGTEIKALREGKGSLSEAYCIFRKGELYLKNMHISEYSLGNVHNHEPTRLRKLLLRKREIKKLQAKVKEKGLTIIPLRMFISDRGLAKVEVGLARGKKIFDKRKSIKEKDNKRDLNRALKGLK
ncbi:MAG: SsrA-binding protein [Chitinophagales bacterium]|nr:SsrA-binding protein [Chitinophagales bacterium]